MSKKKSKTVIEKAVDNINSQIEKEVKEENINLEPVKDDKLSEDEQWAIIAGEGIKYITITGYELFVKPLTIGQKEIVNSFINLDEKKMSLEEQANFTIKQYSEIFNIDKQILKDNLDDTDLVDIYSLLMYSSLKGRSIFEKKNLTVSEIKVFTDNLRALVT